MTYNLKKMIECGYVLQERSKRDRRSSYIKLTEKGLAMCAKLQQILDEQVECLVRRGESKEGFVAATKMLHSLETFWGTLLSTSGRNSLAS